MNNLQYEFSILSKRTEVTPSNWKPMLDILMDLKRFLPSRVKNQLR